MPPVSMEARRMSGAAGAVRVTVSLPYSLPWSGLRTHRPVRCQRAVTVVSCSSGRVKS